MSRIRLIPLIFVLAACGDPLPPPAEVPPQRTPQAVMDDALVTKWRRSCALCHVNGDAGAPRVGNHAEWGPRLAQGMDVLVRNTVEGMTGMPPLGYCMSCEEADLRAMIEFMTAGIPVPEPGP